MPRSAVTPAQLARELQDFFALSTSASLLENGEELFVFAEDTDSARYNVSGDASKCLLHLWSPERTVVRRVLALELRKDSLCLTVQRFGQSKPARMELIRERDRLAPAARKQARLAYSRLLERAVAHDFPDLSASRFTTAMDLERSFGPAYARGTLRCGRSVFAVLGVGAEESQATIDGSLTLGLLWLSHLREKTEKEVVEGLRLIVPQGSSAALRARLACLDRSLAKFELFELDERDLSLQPIDFFDCGNIQTRLEHPCDEASARERFAAAIQSVFAQTPEPARVALHVVSPAEIAFRLEGLQFASARMLQPGLSSARCEITIGAGPQAFELNEESQSRAAEVLVELFHARHPSGDRKHALWRMHPERWLESRALQNICALDSSLDPAHIYTQVPAFAARDRGVIDLLAATRHGRLTLLELKADEDLHLPMQGLDYWSRANWHHQRGEFQSHGYFPGRELSAQPPRLLLVAPALHIHPATDLVLRYFSPAVEWELVALSEHWRDDLRVAFRKARNGAAASARG